MLDREIQKNYPVTFQKTYSYPLTLKEAIGENTNHILKLKSILRFGLFPDVFFGKKETEKKKILFKSTSNFLISKNHFEILRYLSLNLCKEITVEEISQNENIKKEEVLNILNFFEKNLVIKKLENFQKTPKKRKYYFYDLGFRNLVIHRFENFDKRKDFYKLYENFMIIERIKRLEYIGERRDYFYWKNEKGLELPWVEMKGDYLEAFQFEKEIFTSSKSISIWSETYKNAGFTYVYDDPSFQKFIFKKPPLYKT